MREVIDLLDFERKIHDLMEETSGRSQFLKGLRKAQMIALQLARPHTMERVGNWEKWNNEWVCSTCERKSSKISRYCKYCGVKMLNYEKVKEEYGYEEE